MEMTKDLTENDLRNVNYSFFPVSVDHLFHLFLHPPEIEPLETTLGCWKHSFNKNNNTRVNFFLKKECIPVGCVPSAAVAVRWCLHQTPPDWDQAPQEQAHPRPDQAHPPGAEPPEAGTPPL